eukprot:UN02693
MNNAEITHSAIKIMQDEDVRTSTLCRILSDEFYDFNEILADISSPLAPTSNYSFKIYPDNINGKGGNKKNKLNKPNKQSSSIPDFCEHDQIVNTKRRKGKRKYPSKRRRNHKQNWSQITTKKFQFVKMASTQNYKMEDWKNSNKKCVLYRNIRAKSMGNRNESAKKTEYGFLFVKLED